MSKKRFAGWILVLAIATLLMAIWGINKESKPVRQSALPAIVLEESGSGDGYPLTPTLSRQGRGGQPCIFEEGIRGCLYNDRLGRKEGPYACKRYGETEVREWR
jgi:hypothetical protein